MLKKIYVGNLPLNATEKDVRSMFARFGTVHSIKLVTDRETGMSRGYGFVEMERDAARAAATKLNGKLFGKRSLEVCAARERLLKHASDERQSW
jgi:RNA recognition motif-containing protein